MKSIYEYPETFTLLRAYQDWTPTTAIYQEEDAENYLVSGLVAEIFEYAETNEDEEAAAELGDCFWFMSQLANLFEFELGDVVAYGALEKKDNPMVALFSAYAKSYRKHLSREDLREAIRIPFYDVLRELIDLAEDYNGGLTPVLVANQQKLESRKERGVLEGSGGDR